MGSALDTQVVVQRCEGCRRELAWIPASQMGTEIANRQIEAVKARLRFCADCRQKGMA